jgi:hypothetical protein
MLTRSGWATASAMAGGASAGVPEHRGAIDAKSDAKSIEEQRTRVRLVRGHGRAGSEDPRYPKREAATSR